ncbi:peptidoglycan recognition protein family protein [Rhizomonospora bruguierae]|uniref:peptidoglycan recognition protein family protein n=1 Tax=Rhizomonospora bruguierae TaxID=1581705 RepID=UPI001BCC5E90|nr:peptidoglycan recognition family protein [Micromonospora sp. NBRC 107566]
MLTVTAGAAAGAVASIAAATPGSAFPINPDLATPATAPPRPRVPGTKSVRRGVRGGRLRVESADVKVSHLGVAPAKGSVTQVRVRTAIGWGHWKTVHGCTAGRDGYPEAGGVLLNATGVLGYEVWVAGAGSAAVTEIDASSAPRAGLAATAAPASSMPLPGGASCTVPYLSRAAWGANESLRFKNGVESFPAEYYPVQTVTVHHQGDEGSSSDPAATVRAIYEYQCVGQDWGDIGYHLLIDDAGRVYEGRWSGSDGLPIFGGAPGPDGRPQMVTAAHVDGFNSGNIGICLLGDFTTKLPTTAARDSLLRVLASLSVLCRLDPCGTTNFVNPVSGTEKPGIKTIPGHRDWAATECPGNKFYPQLPRLRSEVAYRSTPAPQLTPVPPVRRLP